MQKIVGDLELSYFFLNFAPDVNIITPILTISGSDGIGSSGIQADIKTITSLGGDAMTVITCMALNDGKGMKWHRLHKDVIVDQARTIMDTMHPKAAKIGLIQNPETIKAVRDNSSYHHTSDTRIYSADAKMQRGREDAWQEDLF